MLIYICYDFRLDIYKEISASLDYLYSIMVKNPSVFIPTRPNLIPGILENSALTSEQSSNLVLILLFLNKCTYYIFIFKILV